MNRYNGLLWLLLCLLLFNCRSNKIFKINANGCNKEEMKYAGGEGIFGGFDFEDQNANVLFLSKSLIVIGLDNKPYRLVASPTADLSIIPSNFNLSDIKTVDIQRLFVDQKKSKQYFNLPTWVREFSNVESLVLSGIELHSLADINHLPIKYLVLEDVKIKNNVNLLIDLSSFKHLKYLVHRHKFNSEDILKFKEIAPYVNVVLLDDFEK